MNIFERWLDYSQTELHRKFRISVPKRRQLLIDKEIPVINFNADLGGYVVKVCYVKKDYKDKLNLHVRNSQQQ
jgi:hypothetical protein